MDMQITVDRYMTQKDADKKEGKKIYNESGTTSYYKNQ
jgi:hypothetical protein